MDLIQGLQFYVDKIVSDPNITGMKVLMLDEDTTKIVSMVYSQSDILKKSVYLVERLGASEGHERMVHLNAAIFVRPTRENIQMLCDEMANPRYGEYHIFFSNILTQELMQLLADSDVHEVVKQVHEFYGDYCAVNSELFTLNMPKSLRPDFDSSSLKRTTDGIVSVLLALKKTPEIRFDAASPLAKQVGEAVDQVVRNDKNGHFQSRKFMPATLLVLDRREDPITPLLTQWTYQAMVHEQIGLTDNRANLKKAGAKDIKKKELEEVVMSVTQDEFFAKHTDSNFGDIAMAIRALVNEFQSTSQSNENIKTLEDMQKFMENYPAFRAQSHQVEKHVAVMSELSRQVDSQSLMTVSALEQNMACNDGHSEQYRELRDMLNNDSIPDQCKLKLALIYCVRYEGNGNVQEIKSLLGQKGIPSDDIRLIDAAFQYAGASKRGGDLFGKKEYAKRFAASITQGFQGIDNVYTQHEPLLSRILEKLRDGQLKDNLFPTIAATNKKSNEVIVFFVGGATYEECKLVSQINKEGKGLKVVLGGSAIHNSKSFIAELDASYGPNSR